LGWSFLIDKTTKRKEKGREGRGRKGKEEREGRKEGRKEGMCLFGWLVGCLIRSV
jgi:hypothetical protein